MSLLGTRELPGMWQATWIWVATGQPSRDKAAFFIDSIGLFLPPRLAGAMQRR
jgi:hypothetical protein